MRNITIRQGSGDDALEMTVQVTQEEFEKMEELRRENPEKWPEYSLELVKAAKEALADADVNEKERVCKNVKAGKVDDTSIKNKSGNGKLNKWLKALLIVILSLGLLFGSYLLGSYIYTDFIYPKKAKAEDENLMKIVREDPSKGYDVAQVMSLRNEGGHKSEYKDAVTGRQGVCKFEHEKAAIEAADLYCKYCVDMVKSGDLSDAFELAMDLFEKVGENLGTKYVDAGVSIIKYAADKGNVDAQFCLGYYYGGYDFNELESWNSNNTIDGKSIDYEKQAYWFLQAAEQGHSVAMGNLGNCYMSGKGVSQNKEEGLKWIEKSADAGCTFYQCRLGDYYRDGVKEQNGTHKEKRKSIGYHSYEGDQMVQRYYDNALDDFVVVYLVDVVDYKTIVKVDMKQAQYWWEKAAENGDETAKERLQQIFE